jgi:hypothetical protein
MERNGMSRKIVGMRVRLQVFDATRSELMDDAHVAMDQPDPSFPSLSFHVGDAGFQNSVCFLGMTLL